jgi:hypothetical protein
MTDIPLQSAHLRPSQARSYGDFEGKHLIIHARAVTADQRVMRTTFGRAKWGKEKCSSLGSDEAPAKYVSPRVQGKTLAENGGLEVVLELGEWSGIWKAGAWRLNIEPWPLFIEWEVV